MKICFFGDGDSIHTKRWCLHFASLGHEIHLISFKNVSIKNTTVHHISIGKVDVSGGNWKALLKTPAVKKILRSVQPDIFHAHYATSYGITGALCNYHPYIITTLGSDVLISPQESTIYKVLLKFAFSRADWITAMADHMKTAIEKIGAEPAKVTTVPFGIDPIVFNSRERQTQENEFVITSTRNFEYVYNIPHLLNAIAQVKDKIPELKVNLIGDGSQRKELEDLIVSLNLQGITTFYGKIPQPEIARILNKSHIFVTVSLSDGNNISLNEAMACGALCIATNIPANTQWIKDGENGFLVNINDVEGLTKKILFAYKNYKTLQDKAVPMNERIINESAIWENNMKKVEQKYAALIADKNKK